jgi:hypothetical protein
MPDLTQLTAPRDYLPRKCYQPGKMKRLAGIVFSIGVDGVFG